MSIFDFLHSFIDEVRPQRGGVAFQAPEPISNEEYQAYRQAEIAALEAKYDLSSAEGIMAIPRDASLHHGGGIHSYTGDIDYYLRNKGYGYEKAGNIELAVLCLKKSNEIRMFCRNGYRRDDYYSLVRMLALHGRVDEAQAEKDRIDRFFDSLKESGGIQSRRNKGGDESGSCPGFADGGQGYRPVHCKQRLCVVAVYHRRIQAPAAEHLAVPDGRAGGQPDPGGRPGGRECHGKGQVPQVCKERLRTAYGGAECVPPRAGTANHAAAEKKAGYLHTVNGGYPENSAVRKKGSGLNCRSCWRHGWGSAHRKSVGLPGTAWAMGPYTSSRPL